MMVDKSRLLMVVTLTCCHLQRVICLRSATNCVTSEKDCAGRPQGQYPICEDHSQYVRCVLGTGELLFCSQGQHYDVHFGACNYPDVRPELHLARPKRSEPQPLDQVSPPVFTQPPWPTAPGAQQTPAPTTATTTDNVIPFTTSNPFDLPTMVGADSFCTTTTFICRPGFQWVGSTPQTSHFDLRTMTWGPASGRCEPVSTTPLPDNEFPVVPRDPDSHFGVCLHIQPSAENSSRITVSLLDGQNALLRFIVDYSNNDTVLGSVVGGHELYHLFLNDDCSRFLDFNVPFELVVQQTSDTESKYEVTDGQLSFTGTIEEISESKLNLCNVDRVQVNGDAHVLLVNTRCEAP